MSIKENLEDQIKRKTVEKWSSVGDKKIAEDFLAQKLKKSSKDKTEKVKKEKPPKPPKIKIYSERPLMLVLAEDRKYFTEEKNLNLLLEFARHFNIEMVSVKTERMEILDLEDLTKSINSKDLPFIPTYEVLSVKFKKNDKLPELKIEPKLDTIDSDLINIKEIKQTITDAFIKGELVSLYDLYDKYKSPKINKATISNIMTRTKRELKSGGYTIIKIRPGIYRSEKAKKKDFSTLDKVIGGGF